MRTPPSSSTSVTTPPRPPAEPTSGADRWAPVLIAWSDATELPELAGRVAGVGGSASVTVPGTASSVYVSGLVALDGPDLASMQARPNGRDEVRGVIEHELGHLLGLAHVDDPGELMNPSGGSGITDPQVGDRTGLNRLGAGECFPTI